MPNPEKNAWMLSSKVVVPRPDTTHVAPKPIAVPKIRNRTARGSLTQLSGITRVDDLSKIEPAHLRQGPLAEQVQFIRQKIGQLARENDMLPVSVIPVFEQSALFQTYLKAGSMLIESNMGEDKVVLDQVMAEMENMGQDTLTQQEFEAVADLKKELETMAGI
jgi:hypothetical protein